MVISAPFLHAGSLVLPVILQITYSGMFPNHIPNPEDKTAMKAITQAVADNKADLGIIFDTDVDRYKIYSH
jgi:phosphomannomutase